MAFKSEIHVAELASIRTGHTEGDIYYILDNGILGELPCKPGTFVEWHNNDWRILADERYTLKSEMDAAIGNIGQPLQWKGPSTVAQLNAGITGIQPGWTYTLTDSGTLTDGSITVGVGDEVAWTGTAWFKVGGDGGVKYVSMSDSYSDIQSIIDMGQFPVMKVVAGQGYNYYYPSFEYYQFVFKCVTNNGIYGLRWNGSAWVAQDAVIYGMGSDTKSEVDIDQGVLAIDGGNVVTKVTLATVASVTFSVNESVPAFALEIDNTGNSNDVDVTVVKGATTLKYSTAAGSTVAAGKFVQLTCVGSCWTLAEFEAPVTP